MIRYLGYPCINISLGNDVSNSRTCRIASITKDKINDICLKNTTDLIKILEWNLANKIYYFRLSSNFFPFMDHPRYSYKLSDLESGDGIIGEFKRCGDFIRKHNMRVSCHPGQYTVLASDSQEIINKSIESLKMHSLIGDLLELDGLDFAVNIHVGTKFSKERAKIFCDSFKKMPLDVQKRITVENDDKSNCWSVSNLYDYIYGEIGTPICFDYHHWNCHNGDLNAEDSFKKSVSTWVNRIPEAHISTGQNGLTDRSHAGYIVGPIENWHDSETIDLMFEAKQKDLALIRWREDNKYVY